MKILQFIAFQLIAIAFLINPADALRVKESDLDLDWGVHTRPNSAKPAFATDTPEPTFGSNINLFRFTDQNASIPNPFSHPSLTGQSWGDKSGHHYSSTTDGFNADSSVIRLTRGASNDLYIDGKTYDPLFIRDAPGLCRWHPQIPNRSICMGSGFILVWNPIADSESECETDDVGTWDAGNNQCIIRTDSISGYSAFKFGPFSGDISHDGKCVVAYGKRSSDSEWVVFAYNVATSTKHPDILLSEKFDFQPSGEPKFDYASISPLCVYVYMVGNAQAGDADSTWIYTIAGDPVGSCWCEPGAPSHADLAVDENDDEVAVGPAKNGAFAAQIIKRRLSDGTITALSPTTEQASHASCKSFKRPGWCYLSYGAPSGSNLQSECLAIALDGSGADGDGGINRFVHHQSQQNQTFQAEAHCNPNADGTKILFRTNWAKTGNDETCGGISCIEGYVVELPTLPSAHLLFRRRRR